MPAGSQPAFQRAANRALLGVKKAPECRPPFFAAIVNEGGWTV